MTLRTWEIIGIGAITLAVCCLLMVLGHWQAV